MKDFKRMTVYRCQHCMEFHTPSKKIIKEHIAECVANPANASCARCKNLLLINDMDGERPIQTYYCKHLQKELDKKDVFMLDASCFEERDLIQINQENTEKYDKYIDATVQQIKEISENQEG